MIDRKVINSEITDIGDVADNSDEVRDIDNSLSSTFMDNIMNTILTNFFETEFIGESKPDDGTEEPEGPVPSPNPDMGVTVFDKMRPTVDTHYYFRNDVDKTRISTLNFSF